MEIAEFFVVFIAVISIPFCETSKYGPKRIRHEFDAVRDAMYSIRKDISALFDKTDQLNISAVKDCGLCISDNKSSCLPVTNLDERQDRTKMNDNKVFVKYQTLMKAFATEKKIKDETDRQVQDQLRSMENAISEISKVANERDQQVQGKLRSMENAISESNRDANERNRQVQNQLRSMENAFSESNRVANDRDRQVQNKLRSMENAISESNRVANKRDRQVQDQLRSMENAISESNRVANERDRQVQDQLQLIKKSIVGLHNNISAFVTKISDRINEHLLHSKTSVKPAITTIKPEIRTVTPDIAAVSVINTNCTTVPESGTHTLYLEFIKSNVTVYCDQDTDGGGWTVFMRRQDGSVNFTRPWVDYKYGFGSPDGEFWAGNELLRLLTKERPLQLRIDMEDFNGNTKFALYDKFKIGAEEDKYRLHVSGYSGTAGDSLIDARYVWYKHAGMQFTTFDSDNDKLRRNNCAKIHKGGWWYNSCFDANLNGPYNHGKNILWYEGIIWYSWLGDDEALKRVEMKIR